jgi:hypothetical protein
LDAQGTPFLDQNLADSMRGFGEMVPVAAYLLTIPLSQ